MLGQNWWLLADGCPCLGVTVILKTKRSFGKLSTTVSTHWVVFVLCVFGTCRASVVPAEVSHTWCPHVDFSRAPVFVSLIALELMSAQFLPLSLM